VWQDTAQHTAGGEMSRNEPTQEELTAGAALLKFFARCNVSVTDVDFGDKPDLRFSLSNIPVGCEIVSLMPSDMQQAMRTFFNFKFKNGVDVAKIVIPIEPHSWMKKIIEKKWKIVQGYEKGPYTLNLFLLVHPPMLGHKDIVEYDHEGFIRGGRYGERIAEHGFRKIFYWSGSRIVVLDDDRGNIPPITYDTLPKGYPAYVIYSFMAEKEKFKERFGEKVHLLEVPKEHTKVIRPLTPEFQNVPPLLPTDVGVSFISEGELNSNE
jgi:hypothetical protein